MKFTNAYIRARITSNAASNSRKGGLSGTEIAEIVSWDVVCAWVKSKLKGETSGSRDAMQLTRASVVRSGSFSVDIALDAGIHDIRGERRS